MKYIAIGAVGRYREGQEVIGLTEERIKTLLEHGKIKQVESGSTDLDEDPTKHKIDKPLSEHTVPELKAILDERGVDYAGVSRKDKLLQLLESDE